MAAVLPEHFLSEHGGAVIENHVNLLVKEQPINAISLRTINSLLNSEVIDEIFRCISGSVAVSAYELNAIPLPPVFVLLEFQQQLQKTADEQVIQNLIWKMYSE